MHQKPILVLSEKHRSFTDNSLVLTSPILHKMHVLNFMGKHTRGYKCINQNTSLEITLKSNSRTRWLQSAPANRKKNHQQHALNTQYRVSDAWRLPGHHGSSDEPAQGWMCHVCHRGNVTAGLISLFMEFVVIHSVFCA